MPDKKEKYINPYTDYGFKRLFGDEPSLNAYRDIKNSIDWAEEKGIEKGMVEHAVLVVLRMNEKGYPLAEIAEMTNLSIEKVQQIIDNNSNYLK